MEVDVQYSPDSVLYAFHDDRFKRLTGNDVYVEDALWDDIQGFEYFLEIDGYTYDTREPVASLEEILDSLCTINDQIKINLDVKTKKDIETAVV